MSTGPRRDAGAEDRRVRLARSLAIRRTRGVRKAYNGRNVQTERFDSVALGGGGAQLVGIAARPHRFWTSNAVDRDDIEDGALEVTVKLPQRRRPQRVGGDWHAASSTLTSTLMVQEDDLEPPYRVTTRHASTGQVMEVRVLAMRIARRGAAGGARALVCIKDADGRVLDAESARDL